LQSLLGQEWASTLERLVPPSNLNLPAIEEQPTG